MSSLLEELGIDPEHFEWTQLGICTNSDFLPNDFYDKYEESAEHAKLMDEMCLSCPVMKQCADAALTGKEMGLWAAIYWDGTGKPAANRNEHKTPEVWERIARKLK